MSISDEGKNEMNVNASINVAQVIRHIEAKARDLDANAEVTPSSIVRAVSQGQAIILRELAWELNKPGIPVGDFGASRHAARARS